MVTSLPQSSTCWPAGGRCGAKRCRRRWSISPPGTSSTSSGRPTDGSWCVWAATAGDLTPYEQQILDHVRRAATDGVVPVEALTLGTEGQPKSFTKSFTKAVTADARSRGLSRNRWSPATTALVGVVAVLPALLAAGALVASAGLAQLVIELERRQSRRGSSSVSPSLRGRR